MSVADRRAPRLDLRHLQGGSHRRPRHERHATPGHRQAGLQRQAVLTVQLEIAPEEGAAAAEHDTTTATDLADLGFLTDTPTQQLMTVRYQVAQKLHACTTPRNDGKLNNRAHDLVDLALLEEAVREALPEVREACIEIFFVRDSTPWPPTLRPETGWDILYLRAAEGLEGIVPSTLDNAVDSVTALITAIDSANSA